MTVIQYYKIHFLPWNNYTTTSLQRW